MKFKTITIDTLTRVRVIVQSDKTGDNETIIFTDNFDSPQEDFIIPNLTIDIDWIAYVPTFGGFPLNHPLKRGQ